MLRHRVERARPGGRHAVKVTKDRIARVPGRPGSVLPGQHGVSEPALQILEAFHDDHLEGAVAGAAPG